MDFVKKDKYDIYDLLEVTKILRSENGCVWDREQNHKSIRMNVLEEAYEVMEAIDSENSDMLKEELGDILFQAVFHAQIEAEKGVFDFNDICDDVCKKMIYRHPHVFGDTLVENSQQVLENWDKLKKKSKGQETVADTLDNIPIILPALMRGEKVGKRAKNAGFDYENTEQVINNLKSKINELELAIIHNNDIEIEEEFGNILFDCCSLARFLKKDSEKALTFSINKFIMRFRDVEQSAISMGKDISQMSHEELDKLWKDAKIK